MIGTLVIFSPGLWKGRIESILNEKVLTEKGWHVQIGRLSGNILKTVYGNDILLFHDNGMQLSVGKIESEINLSALLTRRFEFPKLFLNQLTVLPGIELEDRKKSIEQAIGKISVLPLQVDHFLIDGQYFITFADTLQSIPFKSEGSILRQSSGIFLNIDQLEISLPSQEIKMSINEMKGDFDQESVSFSMGSAVVNGIPLTGNVEYMFKEQNLIDAEIRIIKYDIPTELFSQLPLKSELSSLSAIFQFESDFERYSGTLSLSNELGLEMSGEFIGNKYPEYFKLDTLALTGNDAALNLVGIWEKNGRFNGQVKLNKFDFSRWIISDRSTDLSGYLLLEGFIAENQVQFIEISAEVDEGDLYNEDNISLSGTVSYNENILSTSTPVVFSIGPSRVEVKGYSDFSLKELNLALDLTDAGPFLVNNFWSDSLLSGEATGSFQISGPFNQLNARANLEIKDFEYGKVRLGLFILNGSILNVNKFSNGSMKLKFRNGYWNEYGFENGSGEIVLREDEIEITGFEVNNGDDFLQISGVSSLDTLSLNRLQMAYQGHYLVNPKPVLLILSDSGWVIPTFEMHVDDGIIEGFIQTRGHLQGRVKMSNVPADLVHLINFKIGYELTGLVFGEFAIEKKNNFLDINTELNLKNGEIANQPFNDLQISAFYRDGILHLDELTLTHGDKTGLQITGILPLEKSSERNQNVDLSANFKNLDLTVLMQFVQDRFFIDGRITGDFHLGGTTQDTRFEFQSVLQESVFDKIPLGTFEWKGRYDGQNLTISEMISIDGFNYLKGFGTIPVDLNISSENFGRYNQKGEYDINVQGDLENFIYLSTYLTEVDSISGEIDIELGIHGPPSKLMRQGKISMNNTRIYTILMDEPVRDISAKGQIVNNILTLEVFEGKLYDSQAKKPKSPNFKLDGTLDFTRFFQPAYNLDVSGENVFYRSLSKDLEGLADVSIHISGKDTLDISGVIETIDGAMYTEFGSPDGFVSPANKKRVMTNYDIRFPIKGKFAIRNSQIDAKIGGELTMARKGNNPWDYSGEIQFIEGEIYYYITGDVFKNLSGLMSFDGKGFNPFLDLTAQTKIGDAEIRLGVFGPLDNPKWMFDSDKGLSEEDILQLLTFHTRVSEEGISVEGFGTQAQSILGAYLERQFEKNFVQMTGLKSFGLGELSISGTNSLISESKDEDFAISARLNEKFSFNYRRSFSLENPVQNRVGVEYKLNPYFSVVGNVDEKGEMHMKLRLRYAY